MSDAEEVSQPTAEDMGETGPDDVSPTEAVEGPAEAVEEPAEVREEIDYLAPSLLESITTVTPEQLLSMEASEDVTRDTSLEEIIQSSVGDIREDKVVDGRVIGANDREVLVDIGFKSEGIVPREEFGPNELPQIGDEISVYLVRMEDINGQTVLSKEKADFMTQWADIRDKAQTGETISGRVMRRVKGGMIVDLAGVPAFLPGSQIDIRPVQDFDEYIGQEFEFKIVKLNEARKNIVLSRKELLEADLQERRSSLIAQLHAGQVIEGRVKNITDFGVFVDLGGLDGLLHITDLSWGRVNHPSEMVELDELITVKVIDFDTEKQRVSLGLKQLQPHPWDSVELKYPVDSTISGKVVSMTNYGVFVEVEKGVEGLVHVSEMSWTKHIRHPSEMFTLGEAIDTKILNVDVEDRKMSLGVKQLQPDPWDQIEEKYQVGEILKGTVRNLTQFGAFVELEEGIDGLIHITDLSWTVSVRHPRELLKKGDQVQVRVLDVSRENRRIALGLKQVSDDPWDKIQVHFTSGKQVSGEVIRILDKGVILQLEMEMEGLIPLRVMSKTERKRIAEDLKPGDVLKVTVQELNIDDKKVILIPEGLLTPSAPEEGAAPEEADVAEAEPAPTAEDEVPADAQPEELAAAPEEDAGPEADVAEAEPAPTAEDDAPADAQPEELAAAPEEDAASEADVAAPEVEPAPVAKDEVPPAAQPEDQPASEDVAAPEELADPEEVAAPADEAGAKAPVASKTGKTKPAAKSKAATGETAKAKTAAKRKTAKKSPAKGKTAAKAKTAKKAAASTKATSKSKRGTTSAAGDKKDEQSTEEAAGKD
ncbi:MAG: 30S ribosomal protein S1 [Candidatus Neomarinimicrobiota bacterium]